MKSPIGLSLKNDIITQCLILWCNNKLQILKLLLLINTTINFCYVQWLKKCEETSFTVSSVNSRFFLGKKSSQSAPA